MDSQKYNLEPFATVAKFESSFAVDAAALQELISNLDNASAAVRTDGDNFELRLCKFVAAQVNRYNMAERECEIIGDLRKGLGHATPATVRALQTLLMHQGQDSFLIESELGYTELALGLCYGRLHGLEDATKSFRSALTRFQQSEDDTICSAMIENLCRLSEVYRWTDNKDAARATMRQAFRLLPFAKDDWNSLYRLLEEMAAILFATANYQAAVDAYKRLLKAKLDSGKRNEHSTVDILLRMSSVFHTLHQLHDAERALTAAGAIYHELADPDEKQFLEIVQKLAGILFEQGHFVQAEFVRDRANQIIGRAGSSPSYVLLDDILDRANEHRNNGNDAEAKKLYRSALIALEAQRELRSLDRLPILAGIFLLTSSQQQLQRASLLADMELSAHQFFRLNMNVKEAILKTASIYGLLGYATASDDLKMVANEISQAPTAICDSEAEPLLLAI